MEEKMMQPAYYYPVLYIFGGGAMISDVTIITFCLKAHVQLTMF